MTAFSFLALALIGSASPAGALRFSNVFGSHMVLQRGKPAPIWGWDTPGAKVTVAFAGQSYVPWNSLPPTDPPTYCRSHGTPSPTRIPPQPRLF